MLGRKAPHKTKHRGVLGLRYIVLLIVPNQAHADPPQVPYGAAHMRAANFVPPPLGLDDLTHGNAVPVSDQEVVGDHPDRVVRLPFPVDTSEKLHVSEISTGVMDDDVAPSPSWPPEEGGRGGRTGRGEQEEKTPPTGSAHALAFFRRVPFFADFSAISSTA